MSVSLSARLIRAVSGWYVKRINAAEADVVRVRRRMSLAGRLLAPAFGVRVATACPAGVASEMLTPAAADTDKLFLYLHGGAYVMGNPRTHRQLVSHIARRAGVPALVPDYRLAPEHPFPAALDDALAVYRALLDDGIAAERIVVGGDSAGGGLAVALLLRARDEGLPMPAGAILLSPFLDATGSGESMMTRADVDPWFRPESLAVVANYYCKAAERDHPYVSPVFANVAGMPPMYIQVGDFEILLSDSERLADKLQAAGSEVELDVWPGMWHVFSLAAMKMPESRAAISKCAAWLRARLG